MKEVAKSGTSDIAEPRSQGGGETAFPLPGPGRNRRGGVLEHPDAESVWNQSESPPTLWSDPARVHPRDMIVDENKVSDAGGD